MQPQVYLNTFGGNEVKKAIKIDEKDNVATVTFDVETGETIDVISSYGETIRKHKTSIAIPFGHKIALTDLNKGGKVVKYGEVIGVASMTIRAGEWIHTHNVESATVPTSAYMEGGT
jgi:altronate dehydratase small subunit